MKFSIVLPAFNEAGNLPPLVEAVAETCTALGLSYVVWVVDDGSTDRTLEAARELAAAFPVRILVHEWNRGLARALETGLRGALEQAVADDAVIAMDADNTHPPHLFGQMIEALQQGADVVIASRYARGGGEDGVPLMRRFLSRSVGLLLRLRFGLKGVRDYTSGYRAYRARVLQAAFDRYGDRLIESQGFTVMVELLLKLQPFRPKIVEVPLRLRYDRKKGRSKMRLGPTIRGYLALLLLPPANRRLMRGNGRPA